MFLQELLFSIYLFITYIKKKKWRISYPFFSLFHAQDRWVHVYTLLYIISLSHSSLLSTYPM